MSDRELILSLIFDEFNLNRDNTIEKSKIQKTIYILQKFDIKLGYGFSWFGAGPYSSELVEESYSVVHNKEKFSKEKDPFSEASKKQFKYIKKELKNYLDNPQKLELLAASYFVIDMFDTPRSPEYERGFTEFSVFKTYMNKNYSSKNFESFKESDLKEAWVDAANIIAHKNYKNKK